jgi:hypothetical protein
MTSYERRTALFNRTFHFVEQFIFPGLFWYTLFFALFKSFGVLLLPWWAVAVPFGLAFVMLFIFTLLGSLDYIREHRRLKSAEFAAQEALHRAIYKQIEEAKREKNESSSPVH